MHIDKLEIRQSPYVGVFCRVTDELALVPADISKKELDKVKEFDVEIVRATVADSVLLGVLLAGHGSRFVVPELLSRGERDFFASRGISVLETGNLAYGNLVSMNQNGGIVSGMVDKKVFTQIQKFFKGTKLVHSSFSCTDIVGASIVATNKGFIVNPRITEKEFSLLKKVFNVNGKATTANYGDVFIGNNVVANSSAVFVGSATTGTELLRIDEGLRGE